MSTLLRCYPYFKFIKRNYNKSYIKSTAEITKNLSYTFETGRLARFADGAVVLTQGENALLSTTVKGKPDPNFNSLPLSVEYKQSGAAVGKIPNTFFRKEMFNSDTDILTARCVDRSIRPLFKQDYNSSVQVICKPLALDDDCDTTVLSINATSASAYCANLPLISPVGAVRVGLVDDKIIINPNKFEKKKSIVDLLLTGCENGKIVMLEMEGKEIPLDVFQECVKEGLTSIKKIVQSIKELNPNFIPYNPDISDISTIDLEMQKEIIFLTENELMFIFTDVSLDKEERDEKLKNICNKLLQDLKAQFPIPDFQSKIEKNFSIVKKDVMRKETISSKIRMDGRKLDEIRPISMEVDVYKKLHGSALFQRGQSQVFCTVTFDSPEAAFRPDSISQILGTQEEKKFMHQYEFPAYAINEISQSSRQNRREIGHGALAEKALKNMIPNDFPYSIKLNTQVLESNGSTSMAAVVGGTLALLDAGVLLKSPVAGIAMGLLTSENSSESEEKVILTDLNGFEDYAGDMDFKIAGTKNGFNAMQLDIKIAGLTVDLLDQTLIESRKALDFLLDKMAIVQPTARPEFKKTVPVIELINIPMKVKNLLLQNGGYNMKLVESETQTKIKFEEDFKLRLFSPNNKKIEEAKQMIFDLKNVEDFVKLEFGGLYETEIVEILKSGFMIKFYKGTKPVYIKNSDIGGGKALVTDSSYFNKKIGDKIKVRYYGDDPVTGKMRLSCVMIN
ncbi:Polyribonucleotide nucleotidyltransferase 1, mitochondrial [Strongyloides ratti]|uniref:Polyribonucleotide nucleotidyltransferase 1, mitochondrial n=1 Tax=Strongyloides ratti TaxID=34506 RepID=A0A090L363_STRRB|nr:Polyribonucleotide nucleotidyltransferase 1, mitochondrial [Strongyloides ratti]CEF64152.1 Polyribonucleotide nucleotidyltransferase 1, mitochondrial [Strongyloides ratti]